jgi:hypothetical protein
LGLATKGTGEYNLMNHPEMKSNMKGSGLPLSTRVPKVISGKANRDAMAITNKENVTAVARSGASGAYITPLVFYKEI